MKSATSFLSIGAAALLVAMPGIGHATNGSVTLPTFNLTGTSTFIPAPGFPSFWNDVNVVQTRQASGNHLLTAAGSTENIMFYTDANTGYTVSGPANFSLSAVFNSLGQFQSGNMSIFGAVNGYPSTGPGNNPSPTGAYEFLYSATFTGFNYDNTGSSAEQALAFSTNALGGWASQFQTAPESVYLTGFSVNSFLANFGFGSKFKTAYYTGSAITTVPIPAAAWLFGSAVALLTGVRRRKAATA